MVATRAATRSDMEARFGGQDFSDVRVHTDGAAHDSVDGTDAGGGIRVSDPSDQFEREAVANAERVMVGLAPVATSPVAVQRCDDGCGPAESAGSHEAAPVQREAAPPAEGEEE